MRKSLGDILGSGFKGNNKEKVLKDVGYEKPIKTSEHVNAQMEIGGDFTVIKQQGFIRNLVITPRDGKDDMYKFQIRYIDEKDILQEPNDWYSGFKEFPAVDGDYIIFEYKVNGIWKNVKDILDVKNTHEEPSEKDKEELKDVNKEMVEPEITSDLEGDNAIVQLPIEGLSEPYRALLLNGTIHLCTKRGTLTHDEIVAQYCRFLKLL